MTHQYLTTRPPGNPCIVGGGLGRIASDPSRERSNHEIGEVGSGRRGHHSAVGHRGDRRAAGRRAASGAAGKAPKPKPGPRGPRGPQGPQGPQGSAGPAGPTGATGQAGAAGAAGPAGPSNILFLTKTSATNLGTTGGVATPIATLANIPAGKYLISAERRSSTSPRRTTSAAGLGDDRPPRSTVSAGVAGTADSGRPRDDVDRRRSRGRDQRHAAVLARPHRYQPVRGECAHLSDPGRGPADPDCPVTCAAG